MSATIQVLQVILTTQDRILVKQTYIVLHSNYWPHLCQSLFFNKVAGQAFNFVKKRESGTANKPFSWFENNHFKRPSTLLKTDSGTGVFL